MMRDGTLEPGMYRVTTHAGETMDLQVVGIDRRDQGDYLIYLPQSQPNPDRAITVDSKIALGDIALVAGEDGSVWRSGGSALEDMNEVSADELDSIRKWHEASSPVGAPAVKPSSGGEPPRPEGQMRPQTSDSDREGMLTGADIGQGADARQNSNSGEWPADAGMDANSTMNADDRSGVGMMDGESRSDAELQMAGGSATAGDVGANEPYAGPDGEGNTADTSDKDTTPVGESAPKANAPESDPGLRSLNQDPAQHQNAVQHVDHEAIDRGDGEAEQQNLNQGQHPTVTDRPEHLYEEQYQPTVGTGQTPDAHFGDSVTPEQAQFMENQGMNPPPGAPEDPMVSKDIQPNDANKDNPVYSGPGDHAKAAEDLNVEKEPPQP